ncbi:MAG: UDP-N-acetylmuramoyl-L-alanine--D-glutamate ligase, partial [Verrucomicrobiota bacterium]
MTLTGHKIAILGAGKSGLGAARLALKLGAIPVVFDDGDPEKLEKAVVGFQREGITSVIGLDEARAACQSDRFELAVVSPGLDASWPLPRLFVTAGVPLIGELEFAWRELKDTPVVAITGTNGKTTTTELLERVFNGCGKSSIACGNYGLALSEVACSAEKYDVLMVEVSSFQLETITSFHPKVALWLNFAPDHLDRYPNNEAYFAAKRRIFDFMEPDDLTVIRAGESLDTATRKLTFTTNSAVKADFELRDDAIWFRDLHVSDVSALPLQERH